MINDGNEGNNNNNNNFQTVQEDSRRRIIAGTCVGNDIQFAFGNGSALQNQYDEN